MSIIQGNALGAAAYQIANSVRFRSAASAYLSRMPASASNRQKFTWSGWVKRGSLNSRMSFFVGGVTSAGNNVLVLQFDASDRLEVFASTWGSPVDWDVVSTQVFKVPSAWYHIVLSFDSANATAANRALLYVNGVQITALAVASYPALNYTTAVNNTVSHVMGCSIAGQYHLDGYVSEVNFVDGQALDHNSFGNVDTTTGQWVPKKYTGTYGTNGFYLPFNDGSNLTNLCLDRSGNGNNWTASGISLTAGSTYDWMDDTPTNNFAVLNSLVPLASGVSISNGSLRASIGSPAGIKTVQASMAFLSSGKSYVEFLSNNSSDAASGIGFGFFVGAARYGFRASSTGWLEANGSTTASGLSIVTGGQTFQLAH